MAADKSFIKRDDRQELAAYWGRMWKVVSLEGGGGLFLVQFADGVAHRWHHHPRHAEIVYVASGSIEQAIDGRGAAKLAAGDAAVIPRGVRHAARPLEPGTAVLVVLMGDGHDYESVEDPAGATA